MTIFLGLTGSIGMGKSTTAQMFRDLGVAVYDSDATVHQLYAGAAAPLIEKEFPGSTRGGEVDRSLLSKQVVGNEKAMKKLESIVHPLVRQAELDFRESATQQGVELAILDIPLLFETGREDRVDGIIVVTAPADVQKERVMSRPGMDEAKFQSILQRQVPDSEKRKRATYLIDTSKGLDWARQRVDQIIKEVLQSIDETGHTDHSNQADPDA
ncbi:MAG: dephospho-CoA kinase [Rhizobiaceae bacterium]|nr:dephospho-CoA kinase [Rhizobiaceae bacterium]